MNTEQIMLKNEIKNVGNVETHAKNNIHITYIDQHFVVNENIHFCSEKSKYKYMMLACDLKLVIF